MKQESGVRKVVVLDSRVICKRALKQWGPRKQMRQAQEECAELIAAINQFIRRTRSVEHVITEIADVKIMVEQLEHMFDKIAIEKERQVKLARLLDRLDNKPRRVRKSNGRRTR